VRIAILGLGLIGGSIARAVVARGWAVSAWTPLGAGPRRAEPDGVRVASSLADAVADVDLVVIAAPPLASLELVDRLGALGSALSADTVVTDVVSTKAAIVARSRAAGLRFVGGHPLAGRETSGYEAGDAALFRDRPWVVVPAEPADAAADARVEDLIAACGAVPIRMTAAEHDGAVASISHVPLVVSAALVEAAAASED
jgi:prephenate dehydrogenase